MFVGAFLRVSEPALSAAEACPFVVSGFNYEGHEGTRRKKL